MNALPLRVLGPRVLIKPDLDEHAVAQTDSGLYVADSLAAAVTGEDQIASYTSGVIVAIGDAGAPFDVRGFVLGKLATLEPSALAIKALIAAICALPQRVVHDVQVGDRVTFSWKSGQEIDMNGETFVIMKETDILAVLEPAEELTQV